MKVWITKYALTLGIRETEGEIDETGSLRDMNAKSYQNNLYHGEGDEWHRKKESAIKKAEEMRQKKIASLKKQIEELERIRFER